MESRAKFAGHARVTNHARRSSLYPAVTDMFVHMKDIRWKQNYLPKEMFVFKSPVCVLNVRTSTMINIKKKQREFLLKYVGIHQATRVVTQSEKRESLVKQANMRFFNKKSPYLPLRLIKINYQIEYISKLIHLESQ